MGIGSQKLMSFLLATTALSDIVHAASATFADLLLTGETDGFAIDATDVSATPAYTGASYAGYVSVIDTGTPANDLSNVALDSSNLVQSGTSPKMVLWNSSPYVRWTPHNIGFQSQTFDNAHWTVRNGTITANATTAPDGTSTADKFTEATDVAQFHGVENVDTTPVTTLADVVYTYSVYVKDVDRQYIALTVSSNGASTNMFGVSFDLTGVSASAVTSNGTAANTSASITSAGSGWYRLSVTGSITQTDPDFEINLRDDGAAPGTTSRGLDSYNGSGKAVYLWGAQINRGYQATPYLTTVASARIGIPQEYDTAAGQYGILVEPAATNLLTYSEDFTNVAWSAPNTTEVANQAVAPDGATTADESTEEATTAAHQLTAGNISVTSGTAYTFSVFMKKGDGSSAPDWMQMGFGSAGMPNTIYANFNLTTGAVGTSGAGTTTSIVSVGDGWYRCSVTGTSDATVGTAQVSISFTNNNNGLGKDPSYLGSVNANVFLWGAQLETGTVATSYIPTLGSTVTRAVDDIRAAYSSLPAIATGMSMYAWAKLASTSGTKPILALAGTDLSEMQFNGTSLKTYVEDSGATQANFSFGTLTANTAFKIAHSAATNDFETAMDGALSGLADTSGSLPLQFTNLYLGQDALYTSTPVAQIRYYHVIVLPRAYSDAQLQTVTT